MLMFKPAGHEGSSLHTWGLFPRHLSPVGVQQAFPHKRGAFPPGTGGRTRPIALPLGQGRAIPFRISDIIRSPPPG